MFRGGGGRGGGRSPGGRGGGWDFFFLFQDLNEMSSIIFRVIHKLSISFLMFIFFPNNYCFFL